MAQHKQTQAAEPNPGPPAIEKEMDDLSLQQALRDFEVANARVIDLTQRLVEVTQSLAELEARHQVLLAREGDLRREHEAMRSSFAFRLASKIWALRNAINS